MAIRSLGAASAGVQLQRLQAAAVAAAALAFFVAPGAWPGEGAWWAAAAQLRVTREAALMAAVVVSRVGLWGFDLCERQLLQQSAPPRDAPLLFSFEKALAEAAGLLMLLLSVRFATPEQFGVLVGVSVAAVGACSAVLAAN